MNFESYVGYFCSRNHRRGEGVAVYVENSMVSATQLVKSTSMMGFDMVIIEQSVRDKVFFVCVVYRLPNVYVMVKIETWTKLRKSHLCPS